jgi:tetratricopeptide (TPR) repeat protein
MASQLPVARQIAWISLVPQLAFFGLLASLFWWLGSEMYVVLAAATYLFFSFSLRHIIAHDQRSGMRLFHRERFAEAIPHFEKSYDFFSRHSWIDRWRYLALLTSTRISFREMALLNMAFCHSQTGNGPKARELYERTLREFPESKIAQAALRLLDSARSVA